MGDFLVSVWWNLPLHELNFGMQGLFVWGSVVNAKAAFVFLLFLMVLLIIYGKGFASICPVPVILEEKMEKFRLGFCWDITIE